MTATSINRPKEIHVEPYQLKLMWSDGHASLYPMRYLRQSCRCAHCIDELSGAQILDKEGVEATIRCIKAEPMGHYGLAMTFSDMHSTGIYTFDTLRQMCPCCS